MQSDDECSSPPRPCDLNLAFNAVADAPPLAHPLSLETPGCASRLPSTPSSGWSPGKDVRDHVSRGRSLHPQTQVIVVNAVQVLSAAQKQPAQRQEGWRKVDRQTALSLCSGKELLGELKRRLCNDEVKSVTNLDQLVGAITCLSPSTVRRICRVCLRNPDRPSPAQNRQRGRKPFTQNAGKGEFIDQHGKEFAADIGKRTVRLALRNASLGRPRREFAKDLLQLALSEVPVGQKYLNDTFPLAVETVASQLLAQAFATLLHAPLPGLGIPSDAWLDL